MTMKSRPRVTLVDLRLTSLFRDILIWKRLIFSDMNFCYVPRATQKGSVTYKT